MRAPADDQLEDLEDDQRDPILQSGMRIADGIRTAMRAAGRTRRRDPVGALSTSKLCVSDHEQARRGFTSASPRPLPPGPRGILGGFTSASPRLLPPGPRGILSDTSAADVSSDALTDGDHQSQEECLLLVPAEASAASIGGDGRRTASSCTLSARHALPRISSRSDQMSHDCHTGSPITLNSVDILSACFVSRVPTHVLFGSSRLIAHPQSQHTHQQFL